MKLLWICLICAWPLLGQQTLLIDLSGDWRQSSDDKPAYAQADFDDHNWAVVQLPWTSSPVGGVFWLRKSIELPDWANRSKIVLSLGPVREVYDLYVNGQKIATTGPFFDDNMAQIARPRSFAIPTEAMPGGRLIAVSIRTRWPQNVSIGESFRVFQGGPYRITYPENVASEDGQHAVDSRRAIYAPQFVQSALLLTLAGILALFWLAEKNRSELFWLGLVVAARGSRDALAYFNLSLNSFPWSTFSLMYTMNVITGAAVSELLRASVGFRSRWLRLCIWLFWLLAFIWADSARVPDRILEALGLAMLAYGWWRMGGLRQPLERQCIVVVLGLMVLTRLNSLSGGMGLWPVYFTIGERVWSVQSALIAVLATTLTMLILRQLTADRRERQRLVSELEAARVVQQLLLPQVGAATGRFAVDAVYEPAQELGGDFHWSRLETDGSLLVAAGDVSGKGLKAAILVSVAVGILRNEKSASPAAILGALNEGLSGQAGGGFVTCCCARFDSDGTVTIANAGHLAPYCDMREVEIEAGLPLGILTGASYDERVVIGNRFTFVSDGVVEAENARRELFGFERTREISGKSAAEIADAAKAWGQTDDITVVTVRRAG